MIHPLSEREVLAHDPRLNKCFNRMQKLIEAINAHQIPMEIAEEIDDQVQLLETFDGSPKEWRKKIKKTYRSTIAILEK